MNYSGWDLHQQFSQVVVGTKDGKQRKNFKIFHSTGMFDDPEVKKILAPPIEIAVEASSGWYWIVDELEKIGAKVHLAHPLKTKLIAESRVKTDKIDANVLFDLLRTNFLPESYIAPQEVRKEREIHRHRAALVKIKTSVKNRVQSILAKHGVFFKITDVFGVKGREQLKKLMPRLSPVYQKELRRYLDLIDWLDNQIEKIERKIRSITEESPLCKLLCTVPGIGYYSALLILSEIGNIERFSSPKKLISFSGLNPGISKSGKHSYNNLPITKQGNTWIRWVLIQDAYAATKKDERLKTIYERIKTRKGANTAKVVVAREILTSIYWVLKKKKPYCPKSVTPVLAMVSK
jgi:transposase